MYKVKGWLAIIALMAVLLTAVSYFSYSRGSHFYSEGTDGGESLESIFGDKTLHIWYGDEALTDFLTNAAAAYYEETGVAVIPVLHNEAGYLDNIYQASVKDSDTPLPDLFLLGNDSLERAYISGMTTEAEELSDYPETALNAVALGDSYLGYPLYFETTVLLYNRTYMEQAAVSAAERADAETVGEVKEGDVDEDISIDPMTYEEASAAGYTMESVMPDTVAGILEFADNYDAPPEVEAVFKWDVTDIFYNYYFPGSYMNVGGIKGDDTSVIDIYNENTRQCMELYQTLNQFFSIDTEDVSYSKVLDEFMEGKLVMTVVTSDAVAKLEKAASEGGFTWEYDTAMIPDITQELDSRSLSVTTAVVVNGFCEKKESAADFAEYLVNKRSDLIYEEAGKIPALRGALLPNDKLKSFVEEYEYSVSMPKFLGASNFWIQLEACCAQIWEGEDVAMRLSSLQNMMEAYKS